MARQSLLSVVLGLKADKFERGLTSAQRKLKATSTSLSQVGRGLSIGLTAPLAAIGASSFKVAADFELAMKKVKAVSGATGAEFDKLEKNALDLGKSTVFSASSVSELQLEMAKLGLSADEIVKATDSTLALAQAFGNDLGPTAETVVKTINQFGLDAEDAGKVADVMATAFGASALDLEKFAGSMGNVAPVAKEFGFSLEETTALLGVLANNGIEGTDAGTKRKMAFSELAASGVDVKETFTGIINGSVSYADAINILGKRAAILSPIFGKNTDALGELGVELQTAEGRAKNMAAEMDDSASGGIAAMRSALEGAQIQIGNALAPVVLDIINKITDMAQSFGNMSRETQKSIVKAAAFVAAIGPVASIGGGVTRVVLNLSKAFSLVAARGFTASMRFKRMAVVVRTLTRAVRANPLGLLVTAITAVTALAIPFISNMGRMSDEERELAEETRAANLEIAKQIGLLRNALNLDVNTASIKELRDGVSQINAQLDRFNTTAVSSKVSVELDQTGFRVKDIGKIGDELSPLLKQELGNKLQQQINILTAQAIQQGLFGDDAIAFVQSNLQKVVDATVTEYRSGLEAKRDDLQSALNEALDTGDGSSVDVGELIGGDVEVPKTLADVITDLEKQLTDLGELETLFGENFDSEKFGAIESAIKEIVEADFANADETLTGLVLRMQQFAETTKTTSEQLAEDFNDAVATLQAQKGLGIIDDMELAKRTLAELESFLTNSLLANPEFINTEQFDVLNEKMVALRDLLGTNTEAATETANELFTAADAGQVAADIIGAGFAAATGEGQSFGQAVAGIFKNIILNAVKGAVANAVMLAFSPTPDNVATGGISGAAKAATFKAQIAALLASVPKLATGGMTLGPQLALIGDNPSGREAIIPMERMGAFLGQVAQTNQNMNVTGKIQGHDIVLAHERAKRNRGR